MNKKDLDLLFKIQELFEGFLLLVSKDFEYSAPRDNYSHEYEEIKATLELLERLIEYASESID